MNSLLQSEGDACHTAVEGEECFEHVAWAMDHGIHETPEKYEGLTADSSFEESRKAPWTTLAVSTPFFDRRVTKCLILGLHMTLGWVDEIQSKIPQGVLGKHENPSIFMESQ